MARRLLCLAMVFTVATASNDWTGKCNRCKCLWSNGKRTADCTNISLSEIPTDLSPEIREIDFSNNPIYGLGQSVLLKAELRDIHKLKFQNCSIESVHKDAFKGLLLLIELDLSRNLISVLDKHCFHNNLKLRVLSLSHNRLRKLDEGLFKNLTHLQKIVLDYNEIDTIEKDVFVLLPALQHINIAHNRLKTMSYDFTEGLPKINSLNLEGNPWKCDCELQDFRSKTVRDNLITAPTECAEPPRLRGRSWTENVVFACVPKIIEPLSGTSIEATSSNVTLTCRVLGEPQPDVDWVANGRIIDKDPRQNTQRFITSKRKDGKYTWNNLTITNVNYRDKGEYKCVAKNPGGVDEKNITLMISTSGGFGSAPLPLGSALPLIIGLSVGALVILIVILILVCCCCRRSTHGMNAKRRDLIQNSSDECIRLHGQPEIEKALITDVNPVMKPPRVCSVPPSVNSGGTEVSEVKKNLLDNDSVFAGDDESRSLDFDLHLRKSQPLLDPDYRPHNTPYPPDLLPFPPSRMCQVSPAGSSASTVIVAAADPSHRYPPQSPLHSPVYDQISLYRTLPYSRSQSPFVGPSPRVPRQGYVTIPRRPRQQSWSSEPPNPVSDIGEPIYDNLGLRTTADGSSALSLNKIGGESGGGTPKSGRMFPMSPIDPIAEDATLTSWTENRRNSMPNDGKLKIAPIPPPKPKKRTSTGPLFEDEGEDGTEV